MSDEWELKSTPDLGELSVPDPFHEPDLPTCEACGESFATPAPGNPAECANCWMEHFYGPLESR